MIINYTANPHHTGISHQFLHPNWKAIRFVRVFLIQGHFLLFNIYFSPLILLSWSMIILIIEKAIFSVFQLLFEWKMCAKTSFWILTSFEWWKFGRPKFYFSYYQNFTITWFWSQMGQFFKEFLQENESRENQNLFIISCKNVVDILNKLWYQWYYFMIRKILLC